MATHASPNCQPRSFVAFNSGLSDPFVGDGISSFPEFWNNSIDDWHIWDAWDGKNEKWFTWRLGEMYLRDFICPRMWDSLVSVWGKVEAIWQFRSVQMFSNLGLSRVLWHNPCGFHDYSWRITGRASSVEINSSNSTTICKSTPINPNGPCHLKIYIC